MRYATIPTPDDFHGLVEHYLALSSRDRILRFGRLMSAADLCSYVDAMLRAPHEALVVREPVPDLAGVMHLTHRGGISVLGLSVASWARGQGIGSLLLRHAVRRAQLRATRVIYVANLSENTPLRRLGQRAGVNVICLANPAATRTFRPVGLCDPHGDRRAYEAMSMVDQRLLGTSGDALPNLAPAPRREMDRIGE